jgi:protein tyrosine phosphatase
VPLPLFVIPSRAATAGAQLVVRPRSVLLVVISLLPTAVGLSWWSQNKYDYVPKRWGVVVPGKIYRSGQLTAPMLDKIASERHITAIVDLQLNDLQDELLQGEVQFAARHNIRHFRFGLGGDGTGDVNRYVDAVDLVIKCARANQPVLVHCGAGTQRTGGIIACYRMLEEGADSEEVVAELKEYDWNPDHDRVLVDYLNANLPYIADQLVARGTLAERPAEIPRLTY